MATPFRFDRAWAFAVSPEELWTTLEQTECYTTWWPWLRELDIDGARPGLHTGAVAQLLIQAPLPYQLRCTLTLDEAVRPHTLVAHATGDLDGPASLELNATSTGTDARMRWTLEVQSPLLRPLATVARPALAWAHERDIETVGVVVEGAPGAVDTLILPKVSEAACQRAFLSPRTTSARRRPAPPTPSPPANVRQPTCRRDPRLLLTHHTQSSQ